ncbi:MAG TPA: DUF1566 domain-containing protein [Alicycliphilus sp.]|nr:DUF1566 domain-containing protein [Alicycliphilus sp.]
MPLPFATLPLRAAALALFAAALVLPAAAATEEDADDDAAQAAQSAPPQPTLVLSPDGSLVLDTRAHLAWPRCVEGMRWNGTACTGVAQLFTYGEAQALARQRWQADGVRWRLPRVNELRRLVNRKAQPPSVDRELFPAMPRDWVWTGTASVNANTVNPYAYGNVTRGGAGESSLSVQQSWAVDMASGEARGDVGRATRMHVQLVRPAP